MRQPIELTAGQLRRTIDVSRFAFDTTAGAPDLAGIIGQDRAARAIEFGIDIPYPGYNIFATGPAGAGKTSIITRFLETKATTRPIPPDWGYVHNFADADRPRALRLPPGGGIHLRDQVKALLGQAAEALETAFGSDQYADSRNKLGRALDAQRSERLEKLDGQVRERGFALSRTPMGMMVVPIRDGQPLTQEQFGELPEADREAIAAEGQALQEALERVLRQIQDLEEEAQAQLSSLDQKVADATIRPFFEKLGREYAAWPDVISYLDGVRAHMAEHADDFKGGQTAGAAAEGQAAPVAMPVPVSSPYDRYQLNVVVDNSGLAGAPVIVETNPTYANLIGRVEMRAEFGTLVTDYRFIKAGALQRAHGGYLLLDARALLRQPLAWEALKRALGLQRVHIEEMAQQMGMLATTSVTPEPTPLDVKVVLIGDPLTYYTLFAYDEQFAKLFKVRADFAVQMDWTVENEEKIASFIRSRCDEFGLPHFDPSAVAKVVEYSSRLVEDQRKLTTRFAHVSDIIQEAAFWAGRAGHAIVSAQDVARVIDERLARSNQYEERLREMITDGTVMVDTAGAVVGQVNGLAVLELGDYAFGRPNRITCRTFQGRAGVINIEREARLSGRTHDKGVLILAGFLGGRYAQDKPLSVSASMAFEQSYEGVDGDSASSAELYALLSSLAEAPIKQGIAVTGSVNQQGEIQAIGGATAKVEGFFDVCRSMPGGLTGEQGVIIPAANISHLMLREDVVAAVEAGEFHVWSVRTVDEGIEILTGAPAGERDADGAYPPDTINGRVDRKLRDLAEKLQSFGQQARGNRDKERQADESSAPDGEPEPEQPKPGEPDLPGDQPEHLG